MDEKQGKGHRQWGESVLDMFMIWGSSQFYKVTSEQNFQDGSERGTM